MRHERMRRNEAISGVPLRGTWWMGSGGRGDGPNGRAGAEPLSASAIVFGQGAHAPLAFEGWGERMEQVGDRGGLGIGFYCFSRRRSMGVPGDYRGGSAKLFGGCPNSRLDWGALLGRRGIRGRWRAMVTDEAAATTKARRGPKLQVGLSGLVVLVACCGALICSAKGALEPATPTDPGPEATCVPAAGHPERLLAARALAADRGDPPAGRGITGPGWRPGSTTRMSVREEMAQVALGAVVDRGMGRELAAGRPGPPGSGGRALRALAKVTPPGVRIGRRLRPHPGCLPDLSTRRAADGRALGNRPASRPTSARRWPSSAGRSATRMRPCGRRPSVPRPGRRRDGMAGCRRRRASSTPSSGATRPRGRRRDRPDPLPRTDRPSPVLPLMLWAIGQRGAEPVRSAATGQPSANWGHRAGRSRGGPLPGLGRPAGRPGAPEVRARAAGLPVLDPRGGGLLLLPALRSSRR